MNNPLQLLSPRWRAVARETYPHATALDLDAALLLWADIYGRLPVVLPPEAVAARREWSDAAHHALLAIVETTTRHRQN